MKDGKCRQHLAECMVAYLQKRDVQKRDVQNRDVGVNGHKDKMLPRCFLCGFSFASKANLSRHVWGEHADEFQRPFPCPGCKKEKRNVTVAPRRNSWALHVSQCHGLEYTPEPAAAKSLLCLLCDKRFTLRGIHQHMTSWHCRAFQKEFDCPACLKQGNKVTVRNQRGWVDHARDIHNGDQDSARAVMIGNEEDRGKRKASLEEQLTKEFSEAREAKRPRVERIE
jgi:uncharacterized C2H2 Zn-finger protein